MRIFLPFKLFTFYFVVNPYIDCNTLYIGTMHTTKNVTEYFCILRCIIIYAGLLKSYN